MYYIYKVTNKINGKIYIGQTNNIDRRKKQHLYDNRTNHQAFKRALNKYGIDNFNWEIIYKCEAKKEINIKEKYYIDYYNSKVPNGYNIANGGEGGSNWNLQPIVMLDLKGKFIKRYDYITQCEIETGLNHSTISACCKGKHLRYKNYVFMYERDYLKNGPKKYIKPKPNHSKEVLQYDLNGNFINEYESATEASRVLNLTRSSITFCASGRYHTCGGFIWKYKHNPVPSQ